MNALVCSRGTTYLPRRVTPFGEWLRNTRRAKDMTQDELAEKSSYSKSYISNLERGIVNASPDRDPRPAPEAVEALAVALGEDDEGVNRARKLAGYGSKSSDTPSSDYEYERITDDEREEIISSFEGSPRPLRRKALDIVKMLLAEQDEDEDYKTYGKRRTNEE